MHHNFPHVTLPTNHNVDVRFFTKYNPDKLEKVDHFMAKYRGRYASVGGAAARSILMSTPSAARTVIITPHIL